MEDEMENNQNAAKAEQTTENKKAASVEESKERKENVREEGATNAKTGTKPTAKTPAKGGAKASAKSSVKPAEKPAEKAAEKAVEKPTEKPVEKGEEAQKTEEKQTPAFVADPKEKRPKDYAARMQIAARYTDDQAKNMLRKKISQYKEVHLRFLQKIEEPNAFRTEKLFVPVGCGKTDVRYSWKTKANKVETLHEEICTKERRFSDVNKELDVTNFLMEKPTEAGGKQESELIAQVGYDFKKTTREFDGYLKELAPSKRANIEKRGETYTLVYVPVMKTVCTLDGEQYVGYVNLHNGACYSSYKVSDVVERAAEKSALAASFAKRTLLSTFLFSLIFCLLTLLSALKLADWKVGALTTKTVWVSCVLLALSLPSLALMLGINAVKKDALIEKTVQLNKLPGVAWPRFASVVGVLSTVGAVLLFFFQVMI